MNNTGLNPRPTNAASGLSISSVTTALASASIDAWRVHYRALARRAAGEDVIVLSVGDPDFDTPASVMEEAVRALREGDTHYTIAGGVGPLADTIAAVESDQLGTPITPAQVVCAGGAQNALFTVFRCLLDPGDDALLLAPPYTMFGGLASACNANITSASLNLSGGFELDVAAAERALTPRTRLVLANFPHNPSGAMASDEAMSALIELTAERGIWLISDEAYSDLVYDGDFVAPQSLAPAAQHIITVRRLSKSHAMTGWRVGWALCNEELAPHLRNLISHFSYGSPNFVQRAAVRALSGQLDEVREMKAAYRGRRDAFCSALGGIESLRVVKPRAGIFCLLDLEHTSMDGAAFSEALLREHGVAVLAGAAFAPELGNYVRVSLCEPEHRLREAAERIKQFVASL